MQKCGLAGLRSYTVHACREWFGLDSSILFLVDLCLWVVRFKRACNVFSVRRPMLAIIHTIIVAVHFGGASDFFSATKIWKPNIDQHT